MDSRRETSETLRNKCAACFRQYNKMEHLVEHMKVSYHSVHEPRCGACGKHCRSFESLREHLIGPLPKVECARVFAARGCGICLNIFDSPATVRYHRPACQYSRAAPVMPPSLSSMNSIYSVCTEADASFPPPLFCQMPKAGSARGRAVAMACKMVGGGSDGSLDLCARLCIIGEDETVIFQTYVKPTAPVTNYRYEVTGIRPEYLRDAMPLKLAQRRVQDILCNGEPLWKIRPRSYGRARVLVGHGVDQDLERLGLEYPAFMIRDTAKYPPLMKTSKLSNPLKYLTQAYLGYDVHTGVQDPYEDCVAAMRLYIRMRSQAHPRDYASGSGEVQNNYPAWRQRELERMSPEELLALSGSDYYCWCLDP
ncbi:RNA exonuclease 4 isoform X1 [Brachypodium distachyon]|uniref:RNA exonuclease 4 isoform X1 n=1 Tax=Brachypodium distachyon TaxID=15368 RepID=UPI00052FFE3B|nr:RNA exonuclease 4 isoform X1 [Brachypodium distachyon]|eukprot:XP_010235873.1 RNA exonuclease 4 isoform X1 [Brachypodium distachyon]